MSHTAKLSYKATFDISDHLFISFVFGEVNSSYSKSRRVVCFVSGL